MEKSHRPEDSGGTEKVKWEGIVCPFYLPSSVTRPNYLLLSVPTPIADSKQPTDGSRPEKELLTDLLHVTILRLLRVPSPTPRSPFTTLSLSLFPSLSRRRYTSLWLKCLLSTNVSWKSLKTRLHTWLWEGGRSVLLLSFLVVKNLQKLNLKT